MTEPVTTATATSVIKGLGFLFIVGAFVIMAYIIVIALKVPRNSREWVVSLFSTLSVSIGGGSTFIAYFDLYTFMAHSDVNHKYIGIAIIGFIFFLFGLVGWALIRIVFNTIENSDDKDVFQVAKELKSIWKDNTDPENDKRGESDE